MTTYFIADLHLSAQQPQVSQSFVKFCRDKARNARALYILGDFFEYWLGDDALDKTAHLVQRELQTLNQSGVAVYYMAGNRDFLLGQTFADSCGMTILSEPTVIDLYGEKVLLIHGDAECTDDIAYQKVRTLLRNKQWQIDFLQKPIAERIEFAEKARKQSQSHTQNSDNLIMDVNSQAIKKLFKEHAVKTIIHGHTHRPAVHHEQDTTRIVLGDWHHQSSYLAVKQNSMQLILS